MNAQGTSKASSSATSRTFGAAVALLRDSSSVGIALLALVGLILWAASLNDSVLSYFGMSLLLQSSIVLVFAFFGVLGYVFTRLECEPAPMILGFVLGPLMEENLRRAMRISSGDPMIFLERPISLGLLIAALALCLLVALPAIRSKREEAFQEN